VLELRRAVRAALARAAAHPPGAPGERVRNSTRARRLRLYTLEGGQTARVLRDVEAVGTALRAQAAAAEADDGGLSEQRELAVQLLSSEEKLRGGFILIGYLLLDSAGTPCRHGALLGKRRWPMATLIEALAAVVAIPDHRLAIAKPPAARHYAGGGSLSAQQLADLEWDVQVAPPPHIPSVLLPPNYHPLNAPTNPPAPPSRANANAF